MKILLGEDNKELWPSLERLLSPHALDCNATPELTIEKIATGNYNALITDLEYTDGGREGYLVLKAAVPYIPIRILWTGRGHDAEVIKQGTEAGATHVLSKQDARKIKEIIK